VKEFCDQYKPKCDILLAVVKWGQKGGLYLIPLNAQIDVFEELGREEYLHTPKRGTNPRGVEISRKALELLLNHPATKCIPIDWGEPSFEPLAPYKRWIDYWRED